VVVGAVLFFYLRLIVMQRERSRRQAAAAQAANYPFCTIEPNVGRVAVPDARLDKLVAIAKSQKEIPTQLEFVDIAGLVRGASKGEGLGNQFLANIREVDAVLHVVRYRAAELDALLAALDAPGYGLTLGIHSRIDAFVARVAARLRAGNVYVNRNMIGAVVGVQPFGGEGLSGTGPKAGGPHTLLRYCAERTLTVNTAAVGGNAGLLGAED